MNTPQSLTQKAVVALERVGATENLVVKGNLITAADKWGDTWTALVAENLDTLAKPDLESYAGGHFVLVVAKGSEDSGREKLLSADAEQAGAQSEPGAKQGPLVWGL